MTRVVWDAVGTRRYETGVDRGVLYVDSVGVPWNGLISVNERAIGGETKSYYIDGRKYMNRPMPEEYEAVLTAYSSPTLFDACDGTLQFASAGVRVTQQRRKPFGLTYRTMIGNDISQSSGYRIHIVYNATAEPAQRDFKTVSSDVDPLNLSWELTTKPKIIPGSRPSAHIVIDSTEVDPQGLEAIENVLYGDAEYAPRLIEPQEIIDIFSHPFDFTVTENVDGTYTIAGPLANVEMLSATTYQITRDTVVILGPDTAEISSDL